LAVSEATATGEIHLDLPIHVVKIRRSWKHAFFPSVELHCGWMDSPRTILMENDTLRAKITVRLHTIGGL